MGKLNPRVTSWLIVVVVCCLYGTSFVLPAIDFGPSMRGSGGDIGRRDVFPGYLVFLLAPLTLNLPFVGWLANPILWVGVILLATNRPRAAGIAGGIAFLLGLFPLGLLGFEEAGRQLLKGYYLWLSSTAVLTVLALCHAGLWNWPRGPEGLDARVIADGNPVIGHEGDTKG